MNKTSIRKPDFNHCSGSSPPTDFGVPNLQVPPKRSRITDLERFHVVELIDAWGSTPVTVYDAAEYLYGEDSTSEDARRRTRTYSVLAALVRERQIARDHDGWTLPCNTSRRLKAPRKGTSPLVSRHEQRAVYEALRRMGWATARDLTYAVFGISSPTASREQGRIYSILRALERRGQVRSDHGRPKAWCLARRRIRRV